MRCEGIMLIVKDIEAAKNFYVHVLGMEIEHDIGSHVIFREGFSLLIESDWKSFAELQGGSCSYGHHTTQLVFEVDVIEEFVNRIAGLPAVKLLHPLKEHHWGRRAIRLYDPDGHVVEVGESMKVVIKRFLCQGLSPIQAAARSEFPLAYVLMCQQELQDGAEQDLSG